MSHIEPISQNKLFHLKKFLNELIKLEQKDILPNKILLSGPKGIGKSTLAYHFINYVLSKNEDYNYDIKNSEINLENRSFKTILNKSNPNFTLLDVTPEKDFIEINQVRNLILNLNKSSFNDKPRFILIDNIETLNSNSVNALLKILEEPSPKVYFILINNNKKVLQTLLSRCINFKITIKNQECLSIINKLLNDNLHDIINKDLINYYLTPGNIYKLIKFAEINNYDLINLNLKDFLVMIIRNNHYRKNSSIRFLVFDLIEFYLRKNYHHLSLSFNGKYDYFVNRISNTKKFNLDEESLFIEFEQRVLNG
tara:strand:- start:172 stop:1104 length:933 start_codon:yes stop_codon:yes gene_type:complete